MSVILYFVSFMMVIPIAIGFGKSIYKVSNYKSVFWLLMISLIIEIVTLFLMKRNINTLIIFNCFTVLGFVFLFSFYSNFVDSVRKTQLNKIILLVFLLIAVIDLFFINGFKRVNTLTVSIESITLIIYSLFSFYLIMSRMLFEDLLQAPFFWINIAVLFYFSGSLFLFLFGNYLISQGNKAYMEMYKIHTFVNAIWYLFISIGFWKVKKA